MHKDIKWANKELKGLTHDILNDLTAQKLSRIENGKIAATMINSNQGKKNAKSGHMKSIQKIGCSLGGVKGGIVTRDSGKLKIATKLANEANIQKYGTRIVATNINTNKRIDFLSIRQAEKHLKIQAPIIRKIIRGLQEKTRCGWTFELKKGVR
jgi:hypothetical protein